MKGTADDTLAPLCTGAVHCVHNGGLTVPQQSSCLLMATVHPLLRCQGCLLQEARGELAHKNMEVGISSKV